VGRSRAAEYDGYEHQTGMGEQATKGVMDRYFKRMGAGEDFSDCYTADVTWTTLDDGSQVRGASAVREYLVALHENMVDARTRRLIFADSAASLKVTAPTRAPAVSTDLPIALLTTSQATRSARCVATARSHI
jgi:hypothetical protein